MFFDNKDILQHFKFVNWRIGELEISFFDVTNRLDITERQIPQENDLADWSHDKSIVLSRFYNECFQMDHLREIHKRGPSAQCNKQSSKNMNTLLDLCLHFARQDGQDRKKPKKITQLK